MPLPKISPELLQAYQEEIARRSSSATLKRKTASLSKFFNWAQGEGHIEENPISNLEPVVVTSAPKDIKRKQKPIWAFVSLTLGIVAIILALKNVKLPIPSKKSSAENEATTQITSNVQTPVIASPWTIFAKLSLSDSSGSPITQSQTITFKLYKNPEDTTSVWTSNPILQTPDINGSLSIVLDEVPTDVFFQNDRLFLGGTSSDINGNSQTLPSIPVSTANTASNLQGFTPASPEEGATANTIPVISSDGSLILASESPAIKAANGNLLIEGQTVTINAPGGETNILSNLKIQDANLNSGSLIQGYVGNNLSNYDLINLSSGSTVTEKFSVDAQGNTYIAGDTTIAGELSINDLNVNNITASGTITDIRKGTALNDLVTLTLDERNKPTDRNSIYSTLVLKRYDGAREAAALYVDEGNAIFDGQVQLGRFTSNPTAIGTGVLVYNSTDNNLYYWDGTAWQLLTTDSTNVWSRASGYLYPRTITDSLAVGGTGASAPFTVDASGNTKANNLTLTGVVSSNLDLNTNLITNIGNAGTDFDSSGGLTLASDLSVLSQGDVRLYDSDGSNYTGFQAPSNLTGNLLLTLPSTAGTSGYILTTDGAGTLNWADSGGSGGSLGAWTLSDPALYPDSANYNIGIGTATATDVISKLYVTNDGTLTGKALVIFDQTESEDIFTASASATPVMTLGRTGNLSLTNSGANNINFNLSSTGDFTISDNGSTFATFLDTGVFTLDSLNFDATTIGLTTDTDLLSLSSNLITANGDITSTGDINVNGGDLTTTSSSFNLATTATAVSIGAGTGITTINNATTAITGNLDVNGSTNDIAGTLNLSGNNLTSTGAMTVTPGAGTNLNIALSTTGDLAVNTNQLYVDTSAAMVGIGTSAPLSVLDIAGTTAVDALTISGAGAKKFAANWSTNAVNFDVYSPEPDNKLLNTGFESDLTSWSEVPSYTLNDQFTTDRAAGAVNGTSAEPTGGTRTVTDSLGRYSISSGLFTSSGAAATDWTDPRLLYDSVTRSAGKILLGTITPDGTGRYLFGWRTATTGGSSSIAHAAYIDTSSVLRYWNANVSVGAWAASTPYNIALVLRSTGSYFYIKGGVFSNWTLLWIDSATSTTPLYPSIQHGIAVAFTADNFKIPTATWLPTPLAYDTFTRADGAIGNSETTGPDSQTTPSLAWTGGAISTNKNVITPTLESEIVNDVGFDTPGNWTTGSGVSVTGSQGVWTSSSGQLTNAAASRTLGNWYQYTLDVVSLTGGFLQTSYISPSINILSTGSKINTGRAITTPSVTLTGVGATASIDNFSVKPLTLSSLFSSVSTADMDVVASVDATITAGTQGGLVTNLDSAASPANFLIAYHDGTNVKLDKNVGGTYTNLISAAATYSAGATLRVITYTSSGSLKVRVYYNNALVGTEQTVSDAGIISNTKHGLFSTYSGNSFDNFTLWARGTGAEYTGAPFEELTPTRDTTIKYAGTASAKLVAGGTDANFLQSVTLPDTSTYTLTAYAYTTGAAVTTADLDLYYDTAVLSTTFTSVGSGWYRLTGTLTGVASAKDYGVRVHAGKTVYVDSMSLAAGSGDATTLYIANSGTGAASLDVEYSIGTAGTTRIDASGNLTSIGTTQLNGVTYTWPSADGSNGYTLTTNGSGTLSWATLGAGGITPDTLDFTEFQDTLDLDANLTLNQSTYTWTQNFTGTTTTGLSYVANSLTAGEALDITAALSPTDGSINEFIDINLTNSPSTLANTTQGINLSLTDATALANTLYGTYVTVDNSGNTSTGTHSIYGGYYTATGKSAGTTTAIGLYSSASGADNNHAAIFENGNVGIGTTGPGRLGTSQFGTTHKFVNIAGSGENQGILYLQNSDNNGGVTGSLVFGSDALTATKRDIASIQGLVTGTDGGAVVINTKVDGATTWTERLRVDSSGNVGIGDTSPDSKLEVLATTEQLRLTNVDDTTDARFTVSSTGDLAIDMLGSGSTDQLVLGDTDTINIGSGTASDVAYNKIGDAADGPEEAAIAADNDLYIGGDLEVDGTLYATVTGDLTCTDCLDFTDFEDTLDLDTDLVLNQSTYTWTQNFTGDTTTGLTYNANSLTSGSALAISSTATAVTGDLATITLSGSNAANTGSLLSLTNSGTLNTNTSLYIKHYATGTNNLAMRVDDVSGDTTPFVIDGAGKVGIGTTGPSYMLSVAGGDIGLDANKNIYWGAGGTQTYLNVNAGWVDLFYAGAEELEIDINASSATTITSKATGADFRFYTSGTGKHISLMPTGYVGIGDTSPDAKLEVLATTEQLRLTNTDDTTDCRFTVSSTGDMVLDCLGSGTTDQLVLGDSDTLNIGSGTASDVAYNVIAAGTDAADEASMDADNDLYIGGDLEVDGIIYGSIAGDLTCTDCLDFVDLEDTLDLDADLIVNQGTYMRTENFDGTTATGLTYNTDSLTSGKALSLVSDNATVSTAFTGDLTSISYSPTYTGGVGLDTTGNLLDISRSITLNNLGNTLTVSGAVATISDSGTQTAGTLTSTADVLRIAQNYTANSGAALDVTSAGGASGFSLRVNDDGTFTDTTPFVVDNSGNVGIGTTGPLDLLHIKTGDIRIERNIAASTGEFGRIEAWNTAGTQLEAASISFHRDALLADGYSGAIAFNTRNNAERMRITSAGNVGIGTTGPTDKLHVSGNIKVTQGNYFEVAGYTTRLINNYLSLYNTGRITSTDTGNLSLGDNTDVNLYIENTGNVGIGTTGPDAKLDSLATTEQLRLTYTDGTVYTGFTVDSGGDLSIDATGGDVTLAGGDNLNLTAAGDLIFGGTTSLAETTAANDSGAYLVGTFDEFDYSNSINVQGVLNDIDSTIAGIIAGTSGIWTDGGTVTYLTSTADDLAVGGTTLAASMFGIDESAGNFYFGYDNSANPTFNFEATDGDAGELGFNTNDSFYFSNASVGVDTTAPDAKLEINHATGDILRLTYNDSDGSATNYTDFSLDSTGGLTLTGSAASIASGISADKNYLTLTPGTTTLTGTTQVTSLMDTYLVNRGTIAGDTATVTVDDAATLVIAGPPAEGTNVSLTEAYGLKVNSAATTATTAYGLYVDAPTGAGSNYGAIFASGNVGIGTSAPTSTLEVTGNIQLTSIGNQLTFVDDGYIKSSANNTIELQAGGTLDFKIADRVPAKFQYTDVFFYAGAVFNEDSADYDFRVEGNGDVNLIFADAGVDKVGIGTNGPDAKLDSLSTTEQLRLTYADGTVYSSFTVDLNGDLTIAPTGGDIALTSDLAVNGATSADISSTTTTATIFNTTVTTLSLGGAATIFNVATTDAITRAINIGTGTGVDTIHIGDGATGADVITIGSVNAGNVTVQSNATLNLTGSTNSVIDFPNFDVATTGTITTAGDLAVNGGDITTTATTLNVDVGNTGTINFRDGTNALAAVKDQGDYVYWNLKGKSDTGNPATCSEGDIYYNAFDDTVSICHAGNTWEGLDGGGSSLWSALLDPTGNLSLAMAEYTTALTWNTADTAAALDAFTLALTNDATTDSNAQRLLVLQNNDAAGSTTTERLLTLNNADTTEAVTTALEILSEAGGITTAIDVSDAEITTAISTGENDLTGTNWSITGSSGAVSTVSTLNVDSTSTLNNVTLDANADLTFTSGTGSLVINSSVTNASDQVVDIAPSFTGGATDALTYTVMDIAAFSPTNGAGTDLVNGIEIGALTDPGATITSTALKIGSGWDSVLSVNGTTVIDSTGLIPSTRISGTIFNTSADSGTSTLIQNDTLTLSGGTNGIDTSLSGDTYTFNFDSTEVGTTTWGAGSAITWTFDASAGTDTTLLFGDNAITATTGLLTLSGDLAVNGGDLTTTATTFNFDIGDTGTLNFRDGTNVLAAISDQGTTGRLAISDSLQVGSLSTLGYSRFGTGTTGHGLSTSDDLLITSDLELDGVFYLDNGQIANSAGTTTILFSSTPTTTPNTLSASNWFIENTANLGQAALMVNQTKAGDLFTASSSGTPKFTIYNDGDTAMEGQLQIGDFASAPTALGAGSIYFNTSTATHQCYNGSTWYDCAGTLYSTTDAALADGSYITVTHNQNTNNILANAWINDGSNWIEIDDNASSPNIYDPSLIAWYKMEEASGDLDNAETTAANDLIDKNSPTYQQTGRLNKAISFDGTNDYFCSSTDATNCADVAAFDGGATSFSIGGWFKHNTIATNPDYGIVKYSTSPTLQAGDGADGAITVSTSKNINTVVIRTGGTYADGIAYRVNAPADGASSVTRYLGTVTLSNGIAAGDEVMIINLDGASGDTADVGNYEVMEVQSATADTVTFTGAISKSFNGTTSSNQKVVIQRVPNYTTVTIASGGTLTASAWDGLTTTPTGTAGYYTGVVAFRAQTSVTVNGGGVISVNGLGYRGGAANATQGESRPGTGVASIAANDGGGGAGCSSTDGGSGAGGGYGTTGSNGVTVGCGTAVGGGTYGNAQLTTLHLGSGGGGGNNGGDGTGGVGSPGGGVVFITTPSISLGAGITANGNNGGAASGGTSTHGAGGGGGGSGGSIFIASTTFSLGSEIVTATAGAGGAGSLGGTGGAGGVGRIDLDYSATSPGGTQTNPDATVTALQSATGGYKLYMNSSGNYVFGIDDDNTAFPEDSATSGTTYADNNWHFVAAVKNGTSNIQLFIDGQEVGSDYSLSATSSISNTDEFYLGVDYDASSNPWEGLMDEVFVYNRALSAAEVEELYRSNARFKIEQADANNVRLYNYSGQTQNLKLNVTGAGFTNLANPWTDSGSYLYPTGYESLRIYDSAGTNYLSLGNTGTVAQLGWNGTSAINIDSSGNVGIGDTTPTEGKLTVTGNINFTGKLLEDGNEIFSGMIAPFASTCPTGWTEYTAARGRTVVGTPASGTIAGTVGTALTNLGTRTITDVPSHSHSIYYTTGPGDPYIRNNSGSATAGGNYGIDTGAVIATGVASVDVTMPYIQLTYCQKTAGADLAEWIQSNEQIEKTSIVSVDPNNTEKVVTSTQEYDPKVIGIIATVPGWLIGSESQDGVQMALAGRVPTKITLKNGEIKPGDPITTSTIPGTGMKATKSGPSVGKAMEAFNETSSTFNCQDPATGRTEKCGTILVFVNISWTDPSNNQDSSVVDNNQLYYDQVAFDDNLEDGDLVGIKILESPQQDNPNTTERVTHVYKSTESDKQSFVGVISTEISGDGDLLRRERVNNQIISETRIIDSGRAEATVSPTSDNINYGDPLTVSENEGLLKKATAPGIMIGRALERWDSQSGKPKITINVSPTIYVGEDVFITDSGNLNIAQDTNGNYLLTDPSNNNSVIDKVGAFAQIVAANIRVGALTAKRLLTDNITAITAAIDNLSINNKLLSPVVETNLISPLADKDSVVIKIGKIETQSEATGSASVSSFGELLIEDATGSAVASIDTLGNATFSGELYAENIHAKNLEEIEEQLRQVQEDQDLLTQAANWYQTSTESGTFDEVAISNLYVTDQAAINSLSVSSTLTMGTDLVFSSKVNESANLLVNSIDTLTSPLSLQSLAMAPIEIMAGKVLIATNGDVTINANLIVSGKIESPEAKFEKLTTQNLVIANPEATQSGVVQGNEITTNSMIGSAVIPQGVSEMIINNVNISDSTLIYVTPTSETQNNVLYVKSKELGKFVVGFINPIDTEVSFNWWIIETK